MTSPLSILCRASPKTAKIPSMGWSMRMLRSARYKIRGRRYAPVRFHRDDHNFQLIWKATAVLPVPVAIVRSTRRWPFRIADSDEAGQAFRPEAGHRFRFEAGRDSDLMSATWHLLPRIDVMMFCPERLVKRAWIWISAKARVAVGNGGRSALSIAP